MMSRRLIFFYIIMTSLSRSVVGPCLPVIVKIDVASTLQWRHNGFDGVSNHQPHHCLLSRLLGRRSKKTSKPRVTGLCAGNSPGTGEFPTQMASNAENVSIWWRHYACEKWEGCFTCSSVSSRMAQCHRKATLSSVAASLVIMTTNVSSATSGNKAVIIIPRFQLIILATRFTLWRLLLLP